MPDRNRTNSWNVGDHRRKFLRSHGRFVHGETHYGDVVLWAEWEPESRVVARYERPDPHWPRFLYEPFYVPLGVDGVGSEHGSVRVRVAVPLHRLHAASGGTADAAASPARRLGRPLRLVHGAIELRPRHRARRGRARRPRRTRLPSRAAVPCLEHLLGRDRRALVPGARPAVAVPPALLRSDLRRSGRRHVQLRAVPTGHRSRARLPPSPHRAARLRHADAPAGKEDRADVSLGEARAVWTSVVEQVSREGLALAVELDLPAAERPAGGVSPRRRRGGCAPSC